MKKVFTATMCVATLLSCQANAMGKLLPISKPAAGVGAAGVGAGTWFSVNALFKSACCTDKVSAIWATAASIPTTWLSWKLCSRWTADGHQKIAEKIMLPEKHCRTIYGRKKKQTKLLEIVHRSIVFSGSEQDALLEAKKLFVAQKNYLVKMSYALEKLHNDLVRAGDYLHCARRGCKNETDTISIVQLIDINNSLVDFVLILSSLVQQDEDFQQQYENVMKEASISMEFLKGAGTVYGGLGLFMR